MGVHLKIKIFRGEEGGVLKNQYRGDYLKKARWLGRFADLRGGEAGWARKVGVVFLRWGVDNPNAHYDRKRILGRKKLTPPTFLKSFPLELK